MSKLICGIVMPISAMEDCSQEHWTEVEYIIKDAVSAIGYESRIVSSGSAISIIHARIIKNLYEDTIVVCDVSCKNANVMFELGIRLAFDKPVIVIKDDKTDYSFDTSPIEHLSYPRSLNHAAIEKFKINLARKIEAIAAEKEKDPKYSPFLRHFGPIKSPVMDVENVPFQRLILDTVQSISYKLDYIQEKNRIAFIEDPIIFDTSSPFFNRLRVQELSEDERSRVVETVAGYSDELRLSFENIDGSTIITVTGRPLTPQDKSYLARLKSTVMRMGVRPDTGEGVPLVPVQAQSEG